ncbi:hypothetical protein [Lysobacter sp. M2-1]|uniref:hypothetical protein n=1 Tax=Lysobacter sp. M2-1 TaxID=2916839 RepID=UPI001F56CC85|nr:hypothetical protein [Lysobacter sp. M2-1]
MAASQVDGRLRRYVLALKKHDGLASFIQSINSFGEAYIFGGAARDVAFVGQGVVNDLDIIVSGGIDLEELNKFSESWHRTNFGGLRGVVGRFDVDIWDLRKSYAFRYDSSSFISVRNLLNTVCFSTDGIAVSLKSGRSITSPAFDRAFSSKRLDFIVPPTKPEPVVAARIARLMMKLELELTPSVASYFISCYETFGVSELIKAESRWGGKRMLNEVSIELIKADIDNAIRSVYRRLADEASGRAQKQQMGHPS